MISPKSQSRLLLTALGATCAVATAQPEGLLWNEFTPRLAIDGGHIVRGEYADELKFYPLNRSTVILEQGATYESWEFGVGFRTIVWWPFPAGRVPLRRNLRGLAQLSQLQVTRNFGGEENPVYLRFGYFPYKYNPDASNLGEYLYRSGTYPGIVRNTDGYHLIDHALYEAYGARLHVSQAGGALTHNFNLFTEPTTIPVGDLTPAYDMTFRHSIFELGGGVAFNRLISSRPSGARPKEFENAYVRVDSAGERVFEGPFGQAPQKAEIEAGTDPAIEYEAEYWTKRGVKAMARVAVDFGFLVREERRNPGDLRVFAEAALLGVENQPYYYEERWRRIPVMLGVNVPTFRVLDVLSVQGEFYGSEFSNTFSYSDRGYPRWGRPYSQSFDPDISSRDDWKWSVYARKTVNRILKVHAQVANDHLRLPAFTGNVSETELTRNPSHWYYLLRLEGGF